MALPGPGQQALRRGRYSRAGHIYHVITRTHRWQRVLRHWPVERAVVHALRASDQAGRSRTLAFVVMPDHLHWLLELRSGCLGDCVGAAKGRSAWRSRPHRPVGPLWQPGYFDHALRRDESVAATARYIIANPLRAGLVKHIGDWPLWDCVWMDPLLVGRSAFRRDPS